MTHNVGDFCYWPKREPPEGGYKGHSGINSRPSMYTGVKDGRICDPVVFKIASNYTNKPVYGF